MEAKLKILKAMNSIRQKMGLKEFTQIVGLSQRDTLNYADELERAGFVRKIGQGFGITEKGKKALKALTPVADGMEFRFHTDLGRDTGLSATSLKSFCEIVKKVDSTAVEFHSSRGDFENWVKAAFGDSKLAREFERIRKAELKGEYLRSGILKATEAEYGAFEEFLSL